ncbi:MAG: hypothetical protein DBY32_09090 [Phascolarctobacterium sp.]|nr:MAG: hypothetical protein DBY32_09090 [Phascolarctobacterium sp.]
MIMAKITPAEKVETLGTRIKIIRESLGLNQKEFAKKLNTYQVKISDMERDVSQPTLEILKKISTMGFDMNWFLSGSPTANISNYIGKNIEIIKILTVLEKLDSKQLKFISNFLDLYTSTLDLEGGNDNEQNI